MNMVRTCGIPIFIETVHGVYIYTYVYTPLLNYELTVQLHVNTLSISKVHPRSD